MNEPQQKSSQFNLKIVFIVIGIACFLLSITIPVVKVASQTGLYFAPYSLLGSAFTPITVLLCLLTLPLLIFMAIVLLKSPVHVTSSYIFLLIFVFSILQGIAASPSIEFLYLYSRIIAPALFAISIITIAEVTIRNLKKHYFTALSTVALSLAYWFITLIIIKSV